MEGLPNFADSIRKVTEAYAEGFSIMTKMLGTLPRDSAEMRRLGEQWLRLARMIKDGTVTAIDQGFEFWERQVRQMLDATSAAAPATSLTNPMEAWAENWRKGLETMMATGATWSEEARKQTDLLQKTVQEGLLAWQRLWQLPERKF